MRVVAFNGSPRKDGNTSIMINHVLSKIEEAGIDCLPQMQRKSE